jgi:RHS repeat-associated protein
VMWNRLQETDTVPAVGSVPDANRTRTFGYDNLNELISDTTSGSDGSMVANGTTSYAYDNVGNPNTFDGLPTSGFTPDNQINDPGPFTYDGNGNPTTYSSSVTPNSTLAYDVENRLLTDTDTSSTVHMSADYDADGLRTMTATAGGNVYFVYDGDARMLKLNSNGSINQAYAWGADGMRALYNAENTSYYDYSYDPEGNLSQRQSDANISAYYCLGTSVYDAYGRVTGPFYTTGAPGYESLAIGYGAQSGGYTDKDVSSSPYTTGLVEMGHRYYDPLVGRFVNRDPIDYNGGINLYSYAENNPITGSDPSGLDGGWFAKLFQALFGSKLQSGTPRIGDATVDAETAEEGAEGGGAEPLVTNPPAATACLDAGENAAFAEGASALPIPVAQEEELAADALSTGARSGRGAEEAGDALAGAVQFDRSAEAAQAAGLQRIADTGAQETVAGFTVLGATGMDGSTYIRSIFNVRAVDKGAAPLSGLFKAFEAEAKASVADSIVIIGHRIRNPKLFNQALLEHFGYSYTENGDTIILEKAIGGE